jgi:hypothetical protein
VHQQPELNVDQALDELAKRVMDHVDARLAAFKSDLRAELAGVFGPRHDDLANRMSLVEQRVRTVTQTFDGWAQAIRQDTSFTKLIAAQAFNQSAPGSGPLKTPAEDDPRPLQIDHATNGDATDDPARVDLPVYGTVAFIRRDADPEKAWQATRDTIRAGQDAT